MSSISNRDSKRIKEADALLREHQEERKRLVLEALAKNRAGDEAVARVLSILGFRPSPAAAISVNVRLSSYGHHRLQHAVAAVAAGSHISEYERLDFNFIPGEPPLDQSYDFKAMKSAIEPQLRRRAAHYVVIPIVVAASDGPHIQMRALLWGLLDQQAPKMRRSRIAERATTTAVRVAPDDIIDAVAALWDVEPKITWDGKAKTRRQAELAAFILGARMPLNHVCFARGQGKEILTSVMREVVARAGALDLGKTAPLRAEGVDSFLASLPEADGTSCVLPVVKLL